MVASNDEVLAIPASGPDEAAPSSDLTTSARDRRLRRLSLAVAAVVVLETVAILAFGARGDSRFGFGVNLISLGFLGTIISFTAVGAFVTWRRPATKVAWVMIGIGASIATGVVLAAYGVLGISRTGVIESPFALEVLLLSSIFFVPGLGLGTTMLLLLFPTDSLLSRHWRIVAWMAVAGTVIWNIHGVFRPGPISHESEIANPLAAPESLRWLFDLLFVLQNVLITAGIFLAAASLLLRYRRSDRVVRAQIRWFGLVTVIFAVSIALTNLVPMQTSIFFELNIVALAAFPLAIGVAITRYRLFDIDLIINRALVYGSLTAILAGVFTAGVGLAQRIFVLFTGESSDAAIVGATLVIATLYAPLRKRLEKVIDRRFKYESRRFGSYAEQVRTVLEVLDPTRAAEKLATETVSELDATGAAVVGASEAVLASAGTWPPASDVSPTRVALADDGPIRAILVGPRRGGHDHAPADLAALEEVARLTADAVRR